MERCLLKQWFLWTLWKGACSLNFVDCLSPSDIMAVLWLASKRYGLTCTRPPSQKTKQILRKSKRTRRLQKNCKKIIDSAGNRTQINLEIPLATYPKHAQERVQDRPKCQRYNIARSCYRCTTGSCSLCLLTRKRYSKLYVWGRWRLPSDAAFGKSRHSRWYLIAIDYLWTAKSETDNAKCSLLVGESAS